MCALWIGKSGFRATDWDSDERAYVDKPIRHIYDHLKDTCHVEDGVTLKDIIEFTGRDAKLSELIGGYSWCDVQAFMHEVSKPCAKLSDLGWIEISRTITVNDYRRSGPSVDESIDVHGCDGKVNNWAIDFTPVNEMANTPVRLNPKMRLMDRRKVGDDGPKVIVEVDTYFSFLEVVGELFYEISFHGSPQQRDERSLDLLDAVEEIKSGKAKLVPWEEVMGKDDKKVN